MTCARPIVWPLLVNAVTTLFMAGVTWFVQVVHYPSFSRVGDAAFPEYERHHVALHEAPHSCRLPMSTLTLALLSVVTLLIPLSASAGPDPLSAFRWTNRLLVLYVPDTQAGRATLQSFRTSLDDRMEDVLARDLLIVPVGDLPRPGDTQRPAIDLGVPERTDVRRRFGLHGGGAQLVLIGKDGGTKARQSEGVFDLDRVLELIDSMPMRRAEMLQR